MKARLLIHMTAPVVATSLLLLAVVVGAAWLVHRWQRNVSDDLRVNVAGVRAGEELEIVVREIRTTLDYFLITGKRSYLDEVSGLRPKAERWLAEAERWSLTAKEQQMMGRAREGYQRFLAELARLPQEKQGSVLRQRVRRLIDDVLIREVLNPAHDFLDFNEEELEQAIARNEVFADRLIYSLLLLGICGSAAGLVTGFGYARALNRSLVQLSVPIHAAAGQLEEVVGPITFRIGASLKDMENVLRLIAERIGAVVERLRQSEREALRAEQLAALGRMAAAMAHELRNPLTAMKMLVQGAMAGEDWGLEPLGLTGRDLAVLEEEISRLERLTQSFLDFARPSPAEKRKLDVRPLIEQTLRVVAERASAAGTQLEFAPPAEPVLAAVDPGQFRQVLLNLLLNALEAIAGAGVIEVTVATEPDGWLSLGVSDTGCGLPAALGARIFAPFITTKEMGLGLGLSICKRIAEAHGGEITAVTRPEGGAAFTLRLPPSGAG
jgi:signal transduction histidine kinase